MTRRLVRPFWVIGIVWLTVCLVSAWLPIGWLWPLVGGLGVMAVIACCVPSLRRYHALLLALLTAVAAGSSFAYAETVRYQPLVGRSGEETVIRAEVDTAGSSTILRVIDGELPAGTRLYLYNELPGAFLKNHSIVKAEFLVKAFDDRGLSLLQTKAGGIWLTAVPTDASAASWQIEEGNPSWLQIVSDWRGVLTSRVQSVLTGDVGAVVTGICLGADDDLSDEAVSAFRRCGVSHLFAVSGLHLSILTAALLKLLRRLRLSRVIRGVVIVPSVLLFVVLVGGAPSVARAGTMCLLVIVAGCLRRQADARNSLGLALFLLLANDPFAAYDAGLLLSFCATFGLLFLAPSLRRWMLRLPLSGNRLRAWRYIAGAVSITVAATLATLPVAVLYFGSVSLVSVLANLLMTMPASGLLIVGWLGMLAGLLGLAFVAHPLLLAAGGLAKLLLWIAEGLSALPFAAVMIRSSYLVVWMLGSLALLGVGYWLLRRRGVMVAVLCSVLILGSGMVLQQVRMQDTVRIRTLAVGDDIVVYAAYEGHSLVVTAPTELQTVYAVTDLLESEGVTAVDAVFLPSGESQLPAHAATLWREYAAQAKWCYPSEQAEPLWDVGWAEWHEKSLCLWVGEVSIVLDTGNGQDRIGADCVIGAEAIVVYRDGEPYVIPEKNGTFPSLLVKNGELLIK